MAEKGKVESTSSGKWGSFGGNTPMHSFSGTGKQVPGQTAQEGAAKQRGTSKPYKAEGGSTGQYYSSGASNRDFAGTQEPGTSGRTKTGPNNKFAEGGKTHMWGHRGSQKMPEGQSGPNG
jgi:hypothetical protein